MSLAWRSFTSSALVAGLILVAGPGCKSGGGWWAPSWAKWGRSESSTSDLAVSRPTTRVPTPSSGATPTTAGSLAASRGGTGAQDGPYGAGSYGANSPASSYGSQPAGWQGEPHSSVAPAGGYQTGGSYSMAGTPQQPSVTPGSYTYPYGQGAYPETRTADQRGQTYPQTGTSGGAYGGADAYGGAGSYDGGAGTAGQGQDSVYQNPNPSGAYAAPDVGADYGAPPPSDAPGAITEPAASANHTPVYGDSGSLYGNSEATNPAASGANPAETQEVIPNPYSLPSSAPAATRPPTTPTPTTAPATGAAPFTPPTLPSSLSGAPGGYRPGSTASPGSRYGASGTIYEPPVTASGTGYSTGDGTMMR